MASSAPVSFSRVDVDGEEPDAGERFQQSAGREDAVRTTDTVSFASEQARMLHVL